MFISSSTSVSTVIYSENGQFSSFLVIEFVRFQCSFKACKLCTLNAQLFDNQYDFYNCNLFPKSRNASIYPFFHHKKEYAECGIENNVQYGLQNL